MIDEDTDAEDLRDKFDVVIEAVGGRQSTTFVMSAAIARPGAGIAILGVFAADNIAQVPFRLPIYKGLKVVGCNFYGSRDHVPEFATALEMMAGGLVDCELLVSHRLPLTKFDTAFDLIKRKSTSHALKIILEPRVSGE